MDDALRPVDLGHRPVRVHGDDPAAGDAPQQTGTLQVIQGACWMTSEQGQNIPAEVRGTLSPAAAAMYELVDSFRKTPHRCCGTPAYAGRRGKRSTPRIQSSGMSCLGAFSPAAVVDLECSWAGRE